MNYKLIRSSRKTIALQLKDGELIVRAPSKMPKESINDFVEHHKAWIDKQLLIDADRKKQCENIKPLTIQEITYLKEKSKTVFSEKVKYYANLVGVDYGKITVRAQRSRWGSCSKKGNLNFNCLLLLAPEEVIDYIVVHELCHRKEMNHSQRFYDEVLRVYPQYKQSQLWLKTNGHKLIKMLDN